MPMTNVGSFPIRKVAYNEDSLGVTEACYFRYMNGVVCPNCGRRMLERRCKLFCPVCRYTET